MASRVQFSWRGLSVFAIFLIVFTALIVIDKGTGPISYAWGFIIWPLLILTSLPTYCRMWRVRGDFEQVRRVQAAHIAGVLPRRLADWLFPPD